MKKSSNRRDFLKQAGLASAAAMILPSMVSAAAMPAIPPFSDDEHYWRSVRQLFPLSKEFIFLNNGTIGPSPYTVLEAVYEKMKEIDRSAGYGGWDLARPALARFVKAEESEISLTHNVTEGINVVAWGLPLKRGDEVIVTNHEHVGGALPWLNRARVDGIVVKHVTLGNTAAETLNNLEKLISKKTRVLAIPHIVCTTGQIQPVKEIVALGKKHGAFVFIDGAHGPGMLEIDLHDMGCDFYASCCHKWMLGPKGTGFLYVKKELFEGVNALFVGGGSDNGWNILGANPSIKGLAPTAHRYDYGSQNAALYVGVVAAIDFLNTIGMQNVEKRIRGLAGYMQDKLIATGKVEMLTPTEERSRSAVIGFRIKGMEYTKFGELTAKNGLTIRMVAENDLNSVRASTHIYNFHNEVDKLVELINKV